MKNELKGSVFFQGNNEHSPVQEAPLETRKKSSKLAIKQASTLARTHTMILDIRKSVKEVGKETVFLRLTPEEKTQLKDVVYSLSKHRPKISDNEVGRIALNHLLEDYKASGNNSILIRVIEALNA